MVLILFALCAVVYTKILDVYVHDQVLVAQSTVLNADVLPA